MSGPGSWTDERVDLLKQMWDEGLSASAIMRELGADLTRNAVIGKVHRLGLTGRNHARRSTAPRARKPRTRKPSARLSVLFNACQSAPAPVIEPAAETADTHMRDVAINPVTIEDLAPRHCKWPVGDPGTPAFRFCGGKRLHDEEGVFVSPYCIAHHRLAYTSRARGEVDAALRTRRAQERRRAFRAAA